MGLKQTNLNKKEEKVYDAVREFLVEQSIIPVDTDYAMIKYCIANVCSQTLKLLKKNSLDLDSIGLESNDVLGIFVIKSRTKKT